MLCLYCGKKLPFLRRFSDGKFCSEAHREAHNRLQEELAMARLADTKSGRAARKPGTVTPRNRAKVRGDGLPPHAPLLPQATIWADWRKMSQPPPQPETVFPLRCTPESSLRVVVRGFPAAPAAVLEEAVPPPASGGGGLAALAAEPLLLPPEGWFESERPRAREEAVPPVQRLLPVSAGLARLPAAKAPARATAGPLHRRKLVVVVPKSGLWIRSRGPGGAYWNGVALALMPACWRRPPAEGETAPSFSALAAEAVPGLDAALDPPDWVKPSSPAKDARGGLWKALAAADPPQCPRMLALKWPAPQAASPAPGLPVAWAPFSGFLTVYPVRSHQRGPFTAELKLQPLIRFATQSPASTPPACTPLASGAIPEAVWEPARQAAPRRPGVRPAVRQAWPALAGLRPVGERLASGPALQREVPCHALEVPGRVCAPLAVREAPVRQLRPARQVSASILSGAAPGSAFRAQAPLPVAWDPGSPWRPVLQLELQPPEPQAGIAGLAEDRGVAALRALGSAVACPESGTGHAPSASRTEDAPARQADRTETRPLAEVSGSGAAAGAEPEQIPDLCRRLPMMPVRPIDCERTMPTPTAAAVRSCWATLDEPRPAKPVLRLQLDHADGSGPRRTAGRRAAKSKRRPLAAGGRFWVHAPSDLKWIAVALPLLLVVVVYSFRGDKPNNPAGASAMTSTATATAPPETAAQPLLRANALQRFIMRRAGVRLFDDFRGGLGLWQGRENWAKTWRYGDATFVQPGDLALLSSSLGLKDYTLTFLGQIDRRSLNWVFRAKDLDNYYSMRIVITRGGPLPEAVVMRSVVLDGKEREVKTLPIPFTVQADTLYLVRMEVRGQDYTTYIQDQVVDHFTDSRLTSGGVGFYSPRGDRALLRWVEVSHQYDYLGRLCALLSPYGVQNLSVE